MRHRLHHLHHSVGQVKSIYLNCLMPGICCRAGDRTYKIKHKYRLEVHQQSRHTVAPTTRPQGLCNKGCHCWRTSQVYAMAFHADDAKKQVHASVVHTGENVDPCFRNFFFKVKINKYFAHTGARTSTHTPPCLSLPPSPAMLFVFIGKEEIMATAFRCGPATVAILASRVHSRRPFCNDEPWCDVSRQRQQRQ